MRAPRVEFAAEFGAVEKLKSVGVLATVEKSNSAKELGTVENLKFVGQLGTTPYLKISFLVSIIRLLF